MRKSRSFEELMTNTMIELENISPNLIVEMCQEVDKRLRVCRGNNRERFEHLLHN